MALKSPLEVLAERYARRDELVAELDAGKLEEVGDKVALEHEDVVALEEGGFGAMRVDGEDEDPEFLHTVGKIRFATASEDDDNELKVVTFAFGDEFYMAPAHEFFAGLHEALHIFEAHEGGCPGCVQQALEQPWPMDPPPAEEPPA